MGALAATATSSLHLVELGADVDYQATWQHMRDYTDARDEHSDDQLWLLQHPPVFTQGQAGKPEHLLMPGAIPVVQTDRGGQVTYHGPGQLVAYVLLDIDRMGIGVKTLVNRLEQALIDACSVFGVIAKRRENAPGVYVGESKIASIGLRVRHGCSYHGIAFNLAMDLEPFGRINPCGFANMPVTDLRSLVPSADFDTGKRAFVTACLEQFQ